MDLKRLGLVHSIEGSSSGYVIVKEPNEIIVSDVIRILEGDILLTDNSPKEETILQKTIRQSVYDVLNQRIEALLDSITLKDFISK